MVAKPLSKAHSFVGMPMTMTKPVGALTGFARRLRYGNGRRSQAAHRASVCDIGDDVDSFVGVGGHPDTFVVGRVIGLLNREVSPKYGRSVGVARLFWAVWGFGMRRCRFAGFVWFVC